MGGLNLVFEPFSPPFWARNPHAQTVLAHLSNRPVRPHGSRRHDVPLPDNDRLVMLEDRPLVAPRGAALLSHGLGGDASARYMLSVSARLRERGFATFRLNLRGAGEGSGLTSKTYHSGRSGDLATALASVHALYPNLPVVVVGFSMSGNILLKYLGETGASAQVARAVAINPPIDLGLCMRSLESRENRFYHRRFTRLLKTLLEQNAERAERPPLFSTSGARSVREFDTLVTAPSWGFESAEHYYDVSSAKHVVDGIEAPTVVLTSADDPFVPVSTFREVDWPGAVTLLIPDRGGHMGYMSGRRTPLGDRRWLDHAVVEVCETVLGADG